MPKFHRTRRPAYPNIRPSTPLGRRVIQNNIRQTTPRIDRHASIWPWLVLAVLVFLAFLMRGAV